MSPTQPEPELAEGEQPVYEYEVAPQSRAKSPIRSDLPAANLVFLRGASLERRVVAFEYSRSWRIGCVP